MSQPMSFIVQPSAWVGFLVKFEGQTFNAWQSRILHVHGKAQYENWKGPTAKQMWTNVHKVQGRGIWSVYDVFMPLPCRGPRFPVNLKESHTQVVTNITISKYICLRLRSVSESNKSNPMLYFVKKGYEQPIQLDFEIPEGRIRKGNGGGLRNG